MPYTYLSVIGGINTLVVDIPLPSVCFCGYGWWVILEELVIVTPRMGPTIINKGFLTDGPSVLLGAALKANIFISCVWHDWARYTYPEEYHLKIDEDFRHLVQQESGWKWAGDLAFYAVRLGKKLGWSKDLNNPVVWKNASKKLNASLS